MAISSFKNNEARINPIWLSCDYWTAKNARGSNVYSQLL